jgi:hypothetical protein
MGQQPGGHTRGGQGHAHAEAMLCGERLDFAGDLRGRSDHAAEPARVEHHGTLAVRFHPRRTRPRDLDHPRIAIRVLTDETTDHRQDPRLFTMKDMKGMKTT